MSFTFRLRARVQKRFSDTEFPATIELSDFPPLKLSCETEAQRCASDETKMCPGTGVRHDGGRYTFIGSGYASEAQALCAGRSFSDLLLAVGVQRHLGIDVGFERPTTFFGDAMRQKVSETMGKNLIGDRIGLMAYEEGSALILGAEFSANALIPLKQLEAELQTFAGPRPLSDRQRICAALINDSQFASQEEATFILLVSAVEALCNAHDLPQDYVSAVGSLEHHLTNMTSLDKDVRSNLEGVLTSAKRQSVRQSYMTKFRTLIGNAHAKEFDELYKLRSKYLHDGEGRGELRSKTGKAYELSRLLFLADIGLDPVL